METLVGEAIAAQIAPLEARLEESVGQRMEYVIQLTNKQSEETRDQVYEAVRVLPHMIANVVGERAAEPETPRGGERDHTRRWFHFWRSEDGAGFFGEPRLSSAWQQVRKTVTFKRLGNG
jgi:hypothetical protein